jgi:hypothetical protein
MGKLARIRVLTELKLFTCALGLSLLCASCSVAIGSRNQIQQNPITAAGKVIEPVPEEEQKPQ